MHKVRVHVHYKHSLTCDKESDLLQKVKSVVPKLTSGMLKVRVYLQALSHRCQGVRPVPEREECRPQAHQRYVQGKVHWQVLSDSCQVVKYTSEGEECRPQADQQYAQGKGSTSHLQALSDRCQRFISASEGEICHPQACPPAVRIYMTGFQLESFHGECQGVWLASDLL